MIIVKYYEWIKFYPDARHPIWELCKKDPEAEDGMKKLKDLTPEEAKRMIRENNLVCTYSNRHGAVYESFGT